MAPATMYILRYSSMEMTQLGRYQQLEQGTCIWERMSPRHDFILLGLWYVRHRFLLQTPCVKSNCGAFQPVVCLTTFPQFWKSVIGLARALIPYSRSRASAINDDPAIWAHNLYYNLRQKLVFVVVRRNSKLNQDFPVNFQAWTNTTAPCDCAIRVMAAQGLG